MRIKKQKNKARIAFPAYGNAWFVVSTINGACYLSDVHGIESNEWTELYVAELPNPDGYWRYSTSEILPVWDLGDGLELTISDDLEGLTLSGAGTRYDLDDLEKEALMTLAAVAALRKILKERDSQ
jgi:hypothetical protein